MDKKYVIKFDFKDLNNDDYASKDVCVANHDKKSFNVWTNKAEYASKYNTKEEAEKEINFIKKISNDRTNFRLEEVIE